MFYTLVIQFNVNKEKEREEKREKNKKTDYYFFFLLFNITKKPGEYMNELVPSVPPLRLDDSS